MEQVEEPVKKRSVLAPLKGFLFTLVVLAVIWFALRYVLTPLMLPKEVAEAPASTTIPTNAEARIAALEEKITALENKTSEAVDLAPLEARIAALENAPKVTGEAANGAKREDIEALKAELDTIKTEENRTVRSLILVGQLQDAVRAGCPFSGELTALITLRPELKETLTPLVGASATGIATLDQLKEQFAQTINPALIPQTEEKSLSQNLRSLVKIRKVGSEQKGTDDESIIARAEAKLNKGDVAGALQETQSLSPRVINGFAAWQERTETYLAAQGALSSLQASLGSGAAQ